MRLAISFVVLVLFLSGCAAHIDCEGFCARHDFVACATNSVWIGWKCSQDTELMCYGYRTNFSDGGYVINDSYECYEKVFS